MKFLYQLKHSCTQAKAATVLLTLGSLKGFVCGASFQNKAPFRCNVSSRSQCLSPSSGAAEADSFCHRRMSSLENDSSQMAPEVDAQHELRKGAAPMRPPSTVPSRRGKKKHSHRRRKKGTKGAHELSSSVVSEEELAAHVTALYNGEKEREMRRRRHKSARAAMDSRAASPGWDQQHVDHIQYLRHLDNHPALVLNADYQPLSHLPLSLWSWQDAVKAVFSGKVSVVDTYPDILIRAANLDVPVPAVIALNEYIPLASRQRPSFTRRNVFLRDGYRCQYCSERFRTTDLSLDHVVPRSHGGKLCWDNAVTCCKKCNGRKGSLLPRELNAIGMKLMREPSVPSTFELSITAGKMVPRNVHPTWAPYLPSYT